MKGFRIVSASAIAAPATDGKCKYSIEVTYHGQGGGFGAGNGWWVMRSNGWFEDKMLSEIEAKLAR